MAAHAELQEHIDERRHFRRAESEHNMSRKSLAQQAQNLDARHAAHQARTAQPLTARQAAQKSIASIKQNNQGTPAKTLPLTKTSKLDKGLKR